MVRDVRIFLNTLEHAVGLMVQGGVAATSSRQEGEGYIEYTVRIPVESMGQAPPAKGTQSVTLWLSYDHRLGCAPSNGTVRFPDATNSSGRIIDAVEELYYQIADRNTGIRRLMICANRVKPESYVQYDLFTDPGEVEKERNLQRAVLSIKSRYGKNAIMRGANLLDHICSVRMTTTGL